MYYKIFIMMYLTTSFTNAFLFKFPPLDEQKTKLNNQAWLDSTKYFNSYKDNNNGISLDSFKNLFKLFYPVHKLDNSRIETIFKDEVQNRDEFMNLEQFIKVMTKIVIITEEKVNTTYDEYHDRDGKMTKKEFEEFVKGFDYNLTDDMVTNIITENCTDAQNISFPEFRIMSVELYYIILDKLGLRILEEEMAVLRI
ncbi:uncharacterized protein LOC126909167 [Daktulosphaira vitifoliae]|uniref:uncharacterized protein LOC126909167 n=1 Tax=Daktulosphaira vitifoliae TaxID=58002 RepID=UPI0021AAC87C|nr:uncharacterized protein LOC126909167 [Daktulosphaira vitifoliae]